MFEVMLIGLLVLVLILIPLCIGFVAIVRWIMRRTRRVSGQPPVTAAEPLPPPGAAENGVARTESLTAEDTFAFETSGEQVAPSEKAREPQLPVEDVVEILAVNLIGAVPDDEEVVIFTNQGEPLVGDDTPAGQAFFNVCRRILGEEVPLMELDRTQGFLSRISGLFHRNR